jgi:hypothetical protein
MIVLALFMAFTWTIFQSPGMIFNEPSEGRVVNINEHGTT